MKNLDVARAYIENALAYGRNRSMPDSDLVDTLVANLEIIEECLEQPMQEHKEHTWSDFK